MNTTANRFALVAVCIGLFIGATAFTVQHKSAETKTIKLVNKCKFAVHQVFLSPVSEDTWGTDLLDKDEILQPGESVDIEVECGDWDAKLVAEDGSTCTVRDIKLCEADTWEITADC